ARDRGRRRHVPGHDLEALHGLGDRADSGEGLPDCDLRADLALVDAGDLGRPAATAAELLQLRAAGDSATTPPATATASRQATGPAAIAAGADTRLAVRVSALAAPLFLLACAVPDGGLFRAERYRDVHIYGLYADGFFRGDIPYRDVFVE